MEALIGSKIISLQNTASTNIFALEQVTFERPQEGTVVITHDQTEGRGMDTNTWESEPGKNLTFSIILYPSFLQPDKQFYLSMAIVLGILDMVRKAGGLTNVTVKWPNDVYVGTRKICGILIQNTITGSNIDFSIAGIGLNVNQEYFLPSTPNPTSLKMETSGDFDLDEMFALLCSSLENRYQQLRSGNLAIIKADYLHHLYRRGEWHSYLVRGEKRKAMIKGISAYGQLELQAENGDNLTCDIKEVVYL